jgi:hypothetical protein
MRHPFPFRDLEEGEKQDLHIQQKRSVLQVVFIELHLDRYGELVTSVDP